MTAECTIQISLHCAKERNRLAQDCCHTRMPRLVPRLAKQFRKTDAVSSSSHPIVFQRVAKKSKFPSTPPVLPEHTVDFTAPRRRSILLDPVNPIVHPDAFRTHKGSPASLSTLIKRERRVVADDEEADARLGEEEIKQRADPYCMCAHLF